MSSDRHFARTEEPLADEPHRYRLSGLDNVYLLNGFIRHDTAYGPGVQVQDTGALHRAIGVDIVTGPAAITPRELRYLRKSMELTQDQLAGALGVDAQTVARYEKDQSTMPGPVDRLVRMLYFAWLADPHVDSEEPYARMVRLRPRPPDALANGWTHVDHD